MLATSAKLSPSLQSLLLTVLALIAFAANSVLCRLALGDGAIDAASFTLIRLLSGAFTLALLVKFSNTDFDWHQLFAPLTLKSWLAPAMLFIYAIFFSFAYLKLNTATGALILFAAVQFFLIGAEMVRGKKLQTLEIIGIVLAFVGFVWLMLPSASQPSIIGLVLMIIAGIAWGVYTLLGKGSTRPLQDTAVNFIRSAPMAVLIWLIFYLINHDTNPLHINIVGSLLAITSGAIASGLGYAIWYKALAGLSLTQAALSQLTVPLIAALGGILFVGEALSSELAVSALLILSGIGLVSWAKKKSQVTHSNE